jgi:type VI secretion system secreted protein Hcp
MTNGPPTTPRKDQPGAIMKRISVILSCALLHLLFAAPAQAAVNFFLHLDGIDGEVTVKGFEKWIEVSSFSFGASNSTTGVGGGGSASKPVFEDFAFTKALDTASPKIFEYVALGKHIATAELDMVKSGNAQDKLFSYAFTDVLLSSVHYSGTGADVPTESVEFTYGKVKVQSYLQDPKGGDSILGPKFEYDLKNAALVPEPSTWLTMVLGLALLTGGSRFVRRPSRASRRPA